MNISMWDAARCSILVLTNTQESKLDHLFSLEHILVISLLVLVVESLPHPVELKRRNIILK